MTLCVSNLKDKFMGIEDKRAVGNVPEDIYRLLCAVLVTAWMEDTQLNATRVVVTLETSCAVWMACRPDWGCWLCRRSAFRGHNHEGWRMQPWGRTETSCGERRGHQWGFWLQIKTKHQRNCMKTTEKGTKMEPKCLEEAKMEILQFLIQQWLNNLL